MSPDETLDMVQIGKVLRKAKSLARQYRALTGRPLGITGEVAEFEAARLLNLQLAAVRQSGFDAIRTDRRSVCRIQIKARCLLDASKRGQQVGRIDLKKDWHAVLLVILDGDLEPVAIYEVQRKQIKIALLAPGSIARNVRGALSVSQFKAIGKCVWDRNSARDDSAGGFN